LGFFLLCFFLEVYYFVKCHFVIFLVLFNHAAVQVLLGLVKCLPMGWFLVSHLAIMMIELKGVVCSIVL